MTSQQTYASAVQAIIVPDGSDIKTADDMEGKKIGVMQGFTGDLSCTEQFARTQLSASIRALRQSWL